MECPRTGHRCVSSGCVGKCIFDGQPISMEITEHAVGWQLCPKCNGEGSRDAYRVLLCDVCNGKKIISIQTGQPPQ